MKRLTFLLTVAVPIVFGAIQPAHAAIWRIGNVVHGWANMPEHEPHHIWRMDGIVGGWHGGPRRSGFRGPMGGDKIAAIWGTYGRASFNKATNQFNLIFVTRRHGEVRSAHFSGTPAFRHHSYLAPGVQHFAFGSMGTYVNSAHGGSNAAATNFPANAQGTRACCAGTTTSNSMGENDGGTPLIALSGGDEHEDTTEEHESPDLVGDDKPHLPWVDPHHPEQGMNGEVHPVAIPEPSSLALFGIGLAGFGMMRRRLPR